MVAFISGGGSGEAQAELEEVMLQGGGFSEDESAARDRRGISPPRPISLRQPPVDLPARRLAAGNISRQGGRDISLSSAGAAAGAAELARVPVPPRLSVRGRGAASRGSRGGPGAAQATAATAAAIASALEAGAALPVTDRGAAGDDGQEALQGEEDAHEEGSRSPASGRPPIMPGGPRPARRGLRAGAGGSRSPAGAQERHGSVNAAMLMSLLPHEKWTYNYIRDEDNGEGDAECRVCLSEYEPGEEVVRLPCMHYAHTNCVQEWLIRSPHCPICRSDVREILAMGDGAGLS